MWAPGLVAARDRPRPESVRHSLPVGPDGGEPGYRGRWSRRRTSSWLPFTALFGPLFSYNAISIASPALSAFTAYLLVAGWSSASCRRWREGFLFGFSSYEFGQLLGHLHLVMIFLIPVMVHVTLRRVDREISRRAYLFWMALLLVLQMGLSTEWLAECVALGMVLLVAARFLAAQPQRHG